MCYFDCRMALDCVDPEKMWIILKDTGSTGTEYRYSIPNWGFMEPKRGRLETSRGKILRHFSRGAGVVRHT